MHWLALPILFVLFAACTPLPAAEEHEQAPRVAPRAAAFQVPVGDSPAKGAPDAAVTIVEFVDLECPFCRYAHPTIERLLAEHPGDIRWIVKHHPLGFHRGAIPAALFTIAVRQRHGDAAFFEALETFLAAEQLDREVFEQVQAQFRLDPGEIARVLELGSEHPVLIADDDLAVDLEVSGTPTFFVNGIPVSGAQPYAEFEQLVQSELALTARLREAGTPRSALYDTLQKDALPPPSLQKVGTPALLATTPTFGAKDAPVTLHVFSDFECPFCSRVMPTLDALLEAYPDRVRVAWRHYPLPFHRNALMAARAAEQARSQGGNEAFWLMARRMLGSELQPAERLDRPTLERYASELGLEPRAFSDGLADQRHNETIAQDIAAGESFGIEATPGFIINGYRLLGAQPMRRFERLVRLALEEAGQAVPSTAPTAPDGPSAPTALEGPSAP